MTDATYLKLLYQTDSNNRRRLKFSPHKRYTPYLNAYCLKKEYLKPREYEKFDQAVQSCQTTLGELYCLSIREDHRNLIKDSNNENINEIRKAFDQVSTFAKIVYAGIDKDDNYKFFIIFNQDNQNKLYYDGQTKIIKVIIFPNKMINSTKSMLFKGDNIDNLILLSTKSTDLIHNVGVYAIEYTWFDMMDDNMIEELKEYIKSSYNNDLNNIRSGKMDSYYTEELLNKVYNDYMSRYVIIIDMNSEYAKVVLVIEWANGYDVRERKIAYKICILHRNK